MIIMNAFEFFTLQNHWFGLFFISITTEGAFIKPNKTEGLNLHPTLFLKQAIDTHPCCSIHLHLIWM